MKVFNLILMKKILNWIITLKKDYLINNNEILDFIIKMII